MKIKDLKPEDNIRDLQTGDVYTVLYIGSCGIVVCDFYNIEEVQFMHNEKITGLFEKFIYIEY